MSSGPISIVIVDDHRVVREGLRAMLRQHCAWAAEFASWVEADPGFELAAPVQFGLVCFRMVPRAGESVEAADERARDLVSRVNETRRFFLTHTVLNGRYIIRVAIGTRLTEERHVRELWEVLGDLEEKGR